MFGLLTDEANIELDHIQQLTTLNCDVCFNSGALEGVQSFTYLYTENFWQEVFTKITMLQFLNFMMILQKHRRIPHGVDKNLMFSDPRYNSGAPQGVQLIHAMFLQKNDVHVYKTNFMNNSWIFKGYMRFFLLCRIIRQNDCNPDRLRGVLHILYLLQYLNVHVSFNNLTHLVWLYFGIANNCIL